MMRTSCKSSPLRRALTVAGLGLAVALAGCAETELLVHTAKWAKDHATPASEGRYKVGNPYQIKGVWYYPKVDWAYTETGIASWYGPGFHGKLTANGEIFDENAVSAAHRTLPMPSVVRVTNLDNGRSIVVRVNDRGPFAHGRIIDMSRRGAQLLGFERAGTAKVRVEILEAESRQQQAAARGGIVAPPPDPNLPRAPAPTAAPSAPVQVATLNAPNGARAATTVVASPAPVVTAPARPQVIRGRPEQTEIFIQAGSFENPENARRMTGRLAASFQNTHIQEAQVAGRTFYRVRIGPLTGVENADRLLEQVIVAGYPGSRIVLD
jgi:rare lipoprotein A